MTKAEARTVIAGILRFGYFQRRDGTIDVQCSRCRQVVSTARGYRWFPVRPGKPYSDVIDGKRCVWAQETVRQALTRALLDHLLWSAEDGGCAA